MVIKIKIVARIEDRGRIDNFGREVWCAWGEDGQPRVGIIRYEEEKYWIERSDYIKAPGTGLQANPHGTASTDHVSIGRIAEVIISRGVPGIWNEGDEAEIDKEWFLDRMQEGYSF